MMLCMFDRTIKWKRNGQGHKECIVVDQEIKVEDFQEVEVGKTLRDNISCDPDLHQQYRSVTGQIQWLQSQTKFQVCYQFKTLCSSIDNNWRRLS